MAKLRYNPRGHEQLVADETVGLPGLAKGEFTYTRGFTEIAFPCPGGRLKYCIQKIHRAPADEATRTWQWDGNVEAPTLTPSIGCDQRCGWHGHIINGEQTP